MRKVFLGVFAGVCFTVLCGSVSAETDSSSGTGWKQEFSADREQIKEQRDTMHENVQAAKAQERQLKQQIEAAVASGDFETAKNLRRQLHSMHKENVQQMHQDIQAAQEAKQELRSDIKDARGPIAKDKLENIRGRRENIKDRREDIRDHREDIKDRREDFRDKKEDILDRRHHGGKLDRLEDIRDRREDVKDRREDVRDRRENVRDRRENIRDRKINPAGTAHHQGAPAKALGQRHPAAGNRQAGERRPK